MLTLGARLKRKTILFVEESGWYWLCKHQVSVSVSFCLSVFISVSVSPSALCVCLCLSVSVSVSLLSQLKHANLRTHMLSVMQLAF